jgi:hypothetical protein
MRSNPVKFRDPWIDPRILQVRPSAARAYLGRHGWKFLGPAADNPDLLMFDGPAEGNTNPLVMVPTQTDQGPGIQRMIDLVTEVALFEGRYAGDVLTEILQQPVGL